MAEDKRPPADMPDNNDHHATQNSGKSGPSRRALLGSAAVGAALGALATAGLPPETLLAAPKGKGPPGGLPPGQAKKGILLKGGVVLTMDPDQGDYANADVRIEGSKIVAIGPNLGGGGAVIDCTGMIVIPGFSDSHRHMWETQHRAIIAGGSITDYSRTRNTYAPHYRPEDMYIATLLAALGCIECGITTVVDIAHNSRSSAHSDASIEALFDSNIRAVHAARDVAGPGPWDMQLPQDLVRLQEKYFSSDDQLVTLTRGEGGIRPDQIAFARNLGLKLNIDSLIGANASNAVLQYGLAGGLGPDISLIHCTDFSDEAWQIIKDTGTNVCITGRSDTELGLGSGIPCMQKALDFGIRPSISLDNEYSYGGDMFSEMRALINIQRTHAFNRRFQGDTNWPTPLTLRGMLELATVNGAKSAFLDHKVGTLSPGKEADIVLIKEDVKTMPTNNAVGVVVSYADSKNVDTVIIGGKLVKWQGELVGVDLGRIRQMAMESRDYLLNQAGQTLDIFSDTFTRTG